ncbi:MAG: hypothetical protein H7326_01515 [Bdellovibrionaceae bacterium]|nr:hypothetical protein [Pseudobdellovibrionaceae bacterium]
MKTVMLILLQSSILTVFFTAMAQTYIPETTTRDCRNTFFSSEKCVTENNLPLHVSLD